ncbi:S8 family serine peptidase [Acidobacteriota bacterium]
MKLRYLALFSLLLLTTFLLSCNEGEEEGIFDETSSGFDLNESNAPEVKPLPTVESRLENVVDAWFESGLDGALGKARDQALPVHQNKLRVIFVARQGLSDRVAASLAQGGARVEGQDGRYVQALVSPDQIEPLSLIPGVNWVRPPLLARTQVTSEGVSISGANTWQNAQAFADSGETPVEVGIIDLGFQGYQNLVGTELPQNTSARSFRADGDIGAGEIHGVGVAEIVHDMAPFAAQHLVNFSTEVELGQAVTYLINENVSVISHSIGWFNAGPGDGTGPIADIAHRATSRGILWVNAAGNQADQHWEDMFTSADGDPFLDFAPNDETNAFRAFTGEDIFVLMNWDDWPASGNDYDLQLYFQTGSTLELVAESSSVQNGVQEPTEGIVYRATHGGIYHIAVFKNPGARPLRVEIFLLASDSLQYQTPQGSLVSPADSPEVIAVGAAFWSSRQIQSFSSQGPTSDRRVKPDITGYDGVANRTYGQFYGTSASTPHVAGALALMESKIGAAYTMEQIRDILYGRLQDAGSAGPDNVYGRGLLYMRP